MNAGTFLSGVFCGLGIAGIIGTIAARIREARTRAAHQGRPLDNFPDSAQPKLTPVGIVSDSRAAQWEMVVWWLVLIGFISLLLYGAYVFLF